MLSFRLKKQTSKNVVDTTFKEVLENMKKYFFPPLGIMYINKCLVHGDNII